MTSIPLPPRRLTRNITSDSIPQLKAAAKTMKIPTIAAYRISARSKKLEDEAAFTFYRASLPPTALSPYPNYAALRHHQPQLALWCREHAIREYSSGWERKESAEDRHQRLRDDLREFMMRKKKQDEDARQREAGEEEDVKKREAWMKKEMERRGKVGRVWFWGREKCRGSKCCCLL